MTDSTVIEEIKARVRLEDVIGETFPLRTRGQVWTTVEHPSLTVYLDQQRWWWHSQHVGGDLFDWYQRVHRCDFRAALEVLALRAGVELRALSAAERADHDARRAQETVFGLAVAGWHAALLQSPPALAYCASRGWMDETVRHFQLGLSARAGDELAPLGRVLQDAQLADHPAARAVLSAPVDYLVYPHFQAGRCVYFSARSISGKRHWNPPAELVGERRPFAAWPADGRNSGLHLVVEGQADAISLAQMGYRATALCGTKGQVAGATHVAMDTDAAGRAATLDVALAHGPLTGIVEWPGDVGGKKIKDANDLLCAGAPEVVALRVEQATPALQMLAWMAGRLKGDERKGRLEQLFSAYDGLDELTAADMKTALAQSLGGIGNFNRLYKAYKKNRADEEAAAARAENSPDRYVTSAGTVAGGHVFEMCVQRDGEGTPFSVYAVRRPDGKIVEEKTLTVARTCYTPIPATASLIEKSVVLFPSGPMEYGSEAELQRRVQAFVHKFVDLDAFYEKLAAYYILFTWLYDLFENLPYLRALGDYGTGKTRFLQTIGSLCYRPMMVSGASTVSPVFRLIDIFRGTLVVDEADLSNSEAENEMIKILNVGYQRGGVVLRAEKDTETDDYFPSAKEVYGPKLIATRKLFMDRATESRCLTYRTKTRRPRPDIKLLLDREFWDEALGIRNQLLMYRLRNHRPIAIDHGLTNLAIEPRLAQVTLPLKTLITDEQMRREIDLFVRAYNETLISERRMELPAIVVQAMVNIRDDARAAASLAGDMRDFSMAGIARAAEKILKEVDPEQRISPRKVGEVLTQDLGLVKRSKDNSTRRIRVEFTDDELTALCHRYGVDGPTVWWSEVSETSETSETLNGQNRPPR